MSRLQNWKEQHVQSGILPAQFVAAQGVLICAGPPSAESEDGDFSVTSIGLVENALINQAKALQRIYEIGSSLPYIIPGQVAVSMQLARIFVHGTSLLGALYEYYMQTDETTGEKNPFIRDTEGNLVEPYSIPHSGTFFSNMASDFFNQPFGLLFWMMDSQPKKDLLGQIISSLKRVRKEKFALELIKKNPFKNLDKEVKMKTIGLSLTSEEWGELEKRILANIKKPDGPDGCWIWTGSKMDGYPRIRIKNRNVMVHRIVAHRWLRVELDSGKLIVRKCRNRLCLNPAHFDTIKGGRPPCAKKEIRKKIMDRIEKDPNTGCWNWKRTLNSSGYPYIRVNGKSVSVARVVAWIFKGFPLESKLMIRHKCDNRKCVNPDHLEWGTNQENMNDMKRRGRSPNNRGSKNPNSKLKEEDAMMIRILFSQGESIKFLASSYKVTRAAISDVIHGKVWNHLPGAIPRDPQIKFSDDQITDMLNQLAKGYDIIYVAEEYGISASHLRSIWLGHKRKNVPGPRAKSKKPSRVFTEEQVREMRKRYDSGESIRSIADAFNGNYKTIEAICKRRSWRWLKDKPKNETNDPEPVTV